MSINLGKRCKHRDGSFNPDASHDGPQNQINTGSDIKKKKRKRSDLDITYVSRSNMEETLKSKKQKRKAQDTISAPHISEKRNTDMKDQETSMKKRRKKEYNQEIEDITADNVSSSIVLYQETTEKIKKSHKAKATKRLHRDEHFTKETPCSHLTDSKGLSKKKKDHGGRLLDSNLVEESLTTDNQYANKSKKKQKGGGDLQRDGEKLFYQRKSPDFSETPKQVDTSLDQSETAVKKEKKKRKCRSHKETHDITNNDIYSSVVVYQEKNEKRKISHNSKDSKRLSRDEGLPEESIYRELTDVKDRLSRKKMKKHKKDVDLENSLVEGSFITAALHVGNKKTKRKDGAEKSPRQHGVSEELVTKRKHQGVDQDLWIYHSRHSKKTKKWKDGRDLQNDGFTEEHFSYRKSPNGSDALEQVDECLDQVEKPIKKKKKNKKRKDQSHHEAEDISKDHVSSIDLRGHNPSYSERNDKEDRPSHTVKNKKSKKVHLERLLEDSLVEELDELLDHGAQRTNKKKKKTSKLKGGRDESHRQHGYTETTEQGVETEDQTEVHVKKKAKNKKHLDRSEETSEISAEETQPEVGQSLQSRVVESDGNVKHTEQTPTSVQGRPQTSTSTDTDLNPATQDNKSPATSGKYTKERKGKQQSKKPFIRKQDLELIKEYFPQVKEGDVKMKFILSQELERIRIAKQKGIMFRSGQFTIEEDEQIKKNVEKFMAEVGIESPVMLFHPYYFPEQLKTINALRRKFRFSQRIADGLYRSCDDAVARGSLLYRFATSTGRFSEQEVKELKKYHEEHGDDYMAISKLMSRTVVSAQRKISDMNNEVNRGPWSVEETNLLISAVKEFVLDSLRKENKSDEEPVTVPKRKLYKGIKWVQIEKKVVTRNWTHCKARWSNVISTRMNSGFHPCKGDQGRLTNMKMIQWMREADVKDYGDVKWDKLCDDIGNVTSFCAQLNFVALKQSVEGWKSKRLYEIVDFLYEVTLPRLEYQLSSAALEEPEKKEEFLISEMFREYSEFE